MSFTLAFFGHLTGFARLIAEIVPPLLLLIALLFFRLEVQKRPVAIDQEAASHRVRFWLFVTAAILVLTPLFPFLLLSLQRRFHW